METFIKSIEGNDFIFSEIEEDGETKYDVIAGGEEYKMSIRDDSFRFENPNVIPVWILSLEEKISELLFSRNL